MRGWFNKKKRPDWLAGYPVYDAPHIGVGRTLSEVQANENLAYLLANKSDRLNGLSTLLEQFNIDVAAGFASDTPDGLINDLYQWSGEHWKDYHDKNHLRKQWLQSDRSGQDLIYSLAMDTALALGDLLIQHRPTYDWGVDLDVDNIAMSSFRRCVVMAPMVTHDHMAVADIEQAVAGRIFNPDKPHWQWENQWLRFLGDYVSGAHEGTHLT